jgi:hypothetical protein
VATCGVVNFYSAGVATRDRRIGSWNRFFESIAATISILLVLFGNFAKTYFVKVSAENSGRKVRLK